MASTAECQTTSCAPDDDCNKHRVCTFASLEVYDVVRNHLYEKAGCSLACIDECECAVCNTTGEIYDALTATNPTYCQHQTLCHDAMLRKAMTYDASYECDRVFAIALRSLYQLCGTTNGICRDGHCTTADCITPVGSPCRQRRGMDANTSYMIAAYAMMLLYLYLSGRAGLSIKEMGDDGGAIDDTVSRRRRTATKVVGGGMSRRLKTKAGLNEDYM